MIAEATLLHVYNSALAPLGARVLTSVDEDCHTGELCRALWPFARNAILIRHEWGCAIKRAELMRLAETPAYEYSYYYQLPADCLRVLNTSDEYPYMVEGDRLLSDEAECKIRYIAQIENTGAFDPWLLDAMVARLSFELSYAMMANASMTQKLEETAAQKLIHAMGMNTTEAISRYNDSVDWVEVRG